MRQSSKRAKAVMILSLCASLALAQNAGSVRTVTKVVQKVLQPKAIYKFSRLVDRGELKKVRSGVPGLEKKKYELTFKGSKLISRKLVGDDVTPAKDAIFIMRRSAMIASRHEFARAKVVTMVATGYDGSPRSNGGTGRTYTGRRATYGCIAVDPRVIPLGTVLYVDGYGFGIACDIGSAIKGHRVDLCFETSRQADDYGKRPVRVHILRNR